MKERSIFRGLLRVILPVTFVTAFGSFLLGSLAARFRDMHTPSADFTLLALFAGTIGCAIIIAFFITKLLATRLQSSLQELSSLINQGVTKDRFTRARTRFTEVSAIKEDLKKNFSRIGSEFEKFTQQQETLDTVLDSMQEAVIVLGLNQDVVSFNKSATELFELDEMHSKNRPIVEALRNYDLQQLAYKALEENEPTSEELVIHGLQTKYFQAKSSVLKDSTGITHGALLVLNEITKLKKLELLRKEFVANVSHELKTPITSIKGFVETLVEGNEIDPQEQAKFLKIIEKHSNRLNRLIDDLLTLSRLEHMDTSRPNYESFNLEEIVESALSACELKALAKDITIVKEIDRGIVAPVEPLLLEQAIINLVINAVNYSPRGSDIKVWLLDNKNEIIIAVQDNGPGIEEKHLPRLFERFYRVDRGRSREFGGTGLGLSIVKHICQIHGGYPSVQSKVGKGSTFTLHLPRISMAEISAEETEVVFDKKVANR